MRIRQFWREIRGILLSIVWVFSLALGYIGLRTFSMDNDQNLSVGDIVYRTLQLIKLGAGSEIGMGNWMLNVSRFLLPALTVFTIVQGLLLLFDKQIQWVRLWGLRDHIIICGLGRKGIYLTKDLLRTKRKVVVIDNKASKENVNEIRKQGGIVLEGDATKQDVLYSARLNKARYFVCMLGSDNLNLQAAFQAYRISRSRRQGRLTCIVCLSSKDFYQVAKRNELFYDENVSFQLELFNPYDRSARLLLLFDEDLDEINKSAVGYAHLLVVGWGRLGESLIIQAAYSWHLLGRKDRLVISVIDKDAQDHLTSLRRDHPIIDQICEINPKEIDIQSANLLQVVLNELPMKVTRAYICLSDPVLSLQVYQSMVYCQKLKNTPFRIRLAKESGVYAAFESSLFRGQTQEKVMLYDIYEQTCTAELVLSGLHQRLERELYESYCSGIVNSGNGNASTIPSWDYLSNDEKDSNLKQVDRIFNLLNSTGYTVNSLQDWNMHEFEFQPSEIDQMARLEHTLWSQNKKSEDWKYGVTKDDHLKTHPALVSWDMLTEMEREKNRRVIREIPILLAQIGFQIDRL